MASRTPLLAGLDIGTTTTKVVVGQVLPPNTIRVLGAGSADSRGLRKGVVINIEATVEAITKAVHDAEEMAGEPLHGVFATISGGHIKGFNSHGVVGIRNKEVSRSDVAKVIEAARAVAIPMDREVLHVLPQEFIVDKQDGIREPLGISGVRLEAKVHMVTGSVASAQNVVKCANRCGLVVKNIVLSALAGGAMVLSPEEQELGVCYVDLGGGTTDFAVFYGGAVQHTGVLSVGGSHVTNDIAAGLRTPIAAAEKIKCEQAAAVSELVGDNETIEVPSTGGRPPRVMSRQILADIVEPRVQEILSLVRKELEHHELYSMLTGGIVLSGGGANLPGIQSVAEKVFDLPVRVGSARNVEGLSELVAGPEFSASVGLLMHGAHAGTSSSVRGGKFNIMGRLKRAANWLGEHF